MMILTMLTSMSLTAEIQTAMMALIMIVTLKLKKTAMQTREVMMTVLLILTVTWSLVLILPLKKIQMITEAVLRT